MVESIKSTTLPQVPPSRKKKGKKPDKPRADFPLTAHPNGSWVKKINGRQYSFGPWRFPERALARYLDEKDDLYAGRVPRTRQEGGLTVRRLCNRFLTSKRHQLDTGELSPRTFAEYYAACEMIVKEFGKERLVEDLRPGDFERFKLQMPQTWGPLRRGKIIGMTRSVFRYAVDEDLVEKAVKFGKQFKKPSNKVLRLHRAKNGARMFEASELQCILKEAGLQLRTMILLAANCGFGNNDVSSLPIKALDLKGGWVNFPRPKTGVPRRCKLWPETVKALVETIAKRPKPKDEENAGLVLLTRFGMPWVKVTIEKVIGTNEKNNIDEQEDEKQDDSKEKLKVRCDDAVSKEMKKLLRSVRIDGHRNFYAIRHSFETIAGDSRDQVAVNAIMGHVDSSMAGVYRERISDDRLVAVAEHVRGWLFGADAGNAKTGEPIHS
jgi:integrase